MSNNCDTPMAAAGYISYRYPSRSGWIMIGANSNREALSEARRSRESYEISVMDKLQVWDGEKYVPIITRKPG